MTSQIKTVLLLGLLTGIILFLGGALGGRVGLFFAFAFALVMNVGSYWYSDKIVLAMYRAREVAPQDAPALHAIVSDLAREANIPKPRVVIVPQDSPNAFATGRNPEHGVVAVTQGLLEILSTEELRGVLAHEMGHIKNRDILVSTIAGVLASVVMSLAMFARFAFFFGGIGGRDGEGGNPFAALILALVAPIAAMLVQMGISRSREYLADDTGAKLSGHPLYLASALEKLDAYGKRRPMRLGNEATSHMFIVHPFSGKRAMSLFSTHPPIQERIARLRRMAGQTA
ncbi:zinc metalloprotease HtpX [Oceanidesulfovibrio marinus]|uniref:Protease HtpX homolog n=1 Tax=Oceanidesulfovibrio marinus TaxID=370038 RepID=A0ABX6NEM3_9BACT|nr:zinc metalloprotease HtpX [Oceanidesulfovibrio marinus]QJT09075.1 protease HtpX [Oceanidesulfovibrio marinus]